MLLARYYDGVEVHREDKIIICRFLVPHRVLSTCRSKRGGMHEDLMFLYNHQVCEPHGHTTRMHAIAVRDPDEYARAISARYGLPADSCATLGTAANMNNAAIVHEVFRDLEVIAICTGGVETNAGRAGDPASYHEAGECLELLDASKAVTSGTINTILLISCEVTPGALVKAVITATEAKTAVLQELAVPSCYSDGLATGTGTDQIAVACRLGTEKPLTDTGKHSKAGELIGRAVSEAVRQTLALQNGLTPARQCSVLAHIERFGSRRDTIAAEIGHFLTTDQAALLAYNFDCIDQDPLTVAAVAALVHLRDKFVWGILPKSCLPEILRDYGAQVAAAVSGRHDRLAAYRDRLAQERPALDNATFVRWIYLSIALGFADKWDE
ncbi:MAG: adenosylcobinamide amidohydrolase [Anaerolineae bacterium]|nr:adenosylcobinamide amidohydrolase [Anaerolineae bacterium]MDW8100922.1 adenosylcobinamide amidohydrolase [Anaerolineae bacterium]